MWVVLGMCIQCPSKGQKLGGKPCQEIGAKTGKATPTSMDKPFLFKSQPVMAELWQATMWHQAIGNLAKPSKEANSRDLIAMKVENSTKKKVCIPTIVLLTGRTIKCHNRVLINSCN